MSFAGDCSGARILGIGNCGDGSPNWLPDLTKTAGAKLGLLQPRGQLPNLPNIGDISPEYVNIMLRQTRDARPEPIIAKPAGVTDMRFYRVWTERTRVGLQIKSVR